MAEPTVLRFPIAGNSTEYFLLEVASDGSSPLDLLLRGSEGSAAFALKLRQKRIGRHKAPAGPCSDEDWEDILMSTLVDQKPAHDIETRVEIQSEKSTTTANLVFRKNIQGITQRLGTLPIEEKDVEILPFNWCVSAIGAQVKLREELATTSAKVQQLESTANELKRQLEDLITAKDEDETVMLEKFCALLNEKKLKIRQQQSLLATANLDSNTTDDIKIEEEEVEVNPQPRPSKPPRAPKRKASKPLGGEDDTDDGFVKMEIDEDETILDNMADPDSDDMDQDGRQTTDEEDTESEVAEEDEAPPVASTRKGRATRGKAAPATTASGSSTRGKQKGKGKGTKAAAVSGDDDDDEPPPPRSLPFMKKKGAPAPKPADDDDATESDDEL